LKRQVVPYIRQGRQLFEPLKRRPWTVQIILVHSFLQSCKWRTFNQIISFNKVVPLHSGGLTLRVGLNKTFPNRWIGQDVRIPWTPRSAGITLLDFFFYSCVKDQIFHPKGSSVVELRAWVAIQLLLWHLRWWKTHGME
jgi:hypothetical protein